MRGVEHSRARRLATAAVAVLSMACDTAQRTDRTQGEGDVSRGLACDEIRREFRTRLQTDVVLSKLRTCERDEDCTIMRADLECASGQTFVGTCGTPIASVQQDAGTQWLRAVQAELCEDAQPGCRSAPRCMRGKSVCTDRLCSVGAFNVEPGDDAGVAPRDRDEGLACADVIDRAADRLLTDESFISLRTCERDDDCVALPTVFQCAAPVFVDARFCENAIARGAVDAGLARLRSYEQELCPQITGSLGCGRTSTCKPFVPLCKDGVCLRRSDDLAADGGTP